MTAEEQIKAAATTLLIALGVNPKHVGQVTLHFDPTTGLVKQVQATTFRKL